MPFTRNSLVVFVTLVSCLIGDTVFSHSSLASEVDEHRFCNGNGQALLVKKEEVDSDLNTSYQETILSLPAYAGYNPSTLMTDNEIIQTGNCVTFRHTVPTGSRFFLGIFEADAAGQFPNQPMQTLIGLEREVIGAKVRFTYTCGWLGCMHVRSEVL